MAVSHSEPSYNRRAHHTPAILPQIKSRRPTFYDEIIVSPDFVDITAQKGLTSRPPESCAFSSGHSRVFLHANQPNRAWLDRLAEEDRVVQRYE